MSIACDSYRPSDACLVEGRYRRPEAPAVPQFRRLTLSAKDLEGANCTTRGTGFRQTLAAGLAA